MILVLGKNQFGHVLHAIMGPESDLFMDIHGAKLLEVTPAIRQIADSEHIFLSITRCKSEIQCEDMLRGVGATVISSFAGKTFVPGTAVGGKPQDESVAPGIPADLFEGAAPPPKDEEIDIPLKDDRITLRTGKCSYCKQLTKLMPLTNISICADCTEIELGLKRAKKKTVTRKRTPRKKKDDTKAQSDSSK